MQTTDKPLYTLNWEGKSVAIDRSRIGSELRRTRFMTTAQAVYRSAPKAIDSKTGRGFAYTDHSKDGRPMVVTDKPLSPETVEDSRTGNVWIARLEGTTINVIWVHVDPDCKQAMAEFWQAVNA